MVQFAIIYEQSSFTLSTFVFHLSVHLARRVLQLEKINTSLRQDNDREKKKILQLADEVIR